MSMEHALREIYINTDGAKVVALLGFDGVPVVSQGEEENKAVLQGEELLNVVGLIKNMQQHSLKVNFGTFERCLIEAKEHDFFFQVVNYEYFLLFVLKKNGNLGKARYLLKKWTPQIVKDL